MEAETERAIQDMAMYLAKIGFNDLATPSNDFPGALEKIAMELEEIKMHLGHIAIAVATLAERDQ